MLYYLLLLATIIVSVDARNGYEYPRRNGYEYPRFGHRDEVPVHAIRYFSIGKITNNTKRNLVLRINGKNVLKIPAGKTVRNKIDLPALEYSGLPYRSVVIATSQGQDLFYIGAERYRNYSEINSHVAVFSLQKLGYGEWPDQGSWRDRFHHEGNDDRYTIQLTFNEENGKIVLEDEDLEVAASY